MRLRVLASLCDRGVPSIRFHRLVVSARKRNLFPALPCPSCPVLPTFSHPRGNSDPGSLFAFPNTSFVTHRGGGRGRGEEREVGRDVSEKGLFTKGVASFVTGWWELGPRKPWENHSRPGRLSGRERWLHARQPYSAPFRSERQLDNEIPRIVQREIYWGSERGRGRGPGGRAETEKRTGGKDYSREERVSIIARSC